MIRVISWLRGCKFKVGDLVKERRCLCYIHRVTGIRWGDGWEISLDGDDEFWIKEKQFTLLHRGKKQ